MSVLRSDLRPGVYCDSIVLMQLQSALSGLPGVEDAGAVMGTKENLQLLKANGLLPDRLRPDPGPTDLLLVLRAESEDAAAAALGRVDELLARRRTIETGEFRPRTLASASGQRPDGRWVLVSVPGRHAARVAREALDLDRHVFLFSDNVPLEAEVALKRTARERGLLVMGPDCGTAIVNGAGFGFANRVRRGGVGLVAASGTGLQAIAAHVHRAGAGVSHAIGTGGRDLWADVGAITSLQALELLSRDPGTKVIVLVSKPPAPDVAVRVLAAAETTGKPVVIYFLGAPPYSTAGRPAGGRLYEATSLREAADRAVALLHSEAASPPHPEARDRAGPGGRPAASADSDSVGGCLRGLFAGGTLASEAVLALRDVLPLHSNIGAERVDPLPGSSRSLGHTILDLGADEFTVGRPHPMLDHELRIQRLVREAADPDVGVVLLDVVLGDGSHPDPASALAPAIEEATKRRHVRVVALLIGTDEDPQDLAAQTRILARAGACVAHDVEEALERVCRHLDIRVPGPGRRSREGAPMPTREGTREGTREETRGGRTARPVARPVPPAPGDGAARPVDLADLQSPVSAINVGLESFHESLVAQEVDAIHVDWRPPAGGDERLLAILDKMRAPRERQ